MLPRQLGLARGNQTHKARSRKLLSPGDFAVVALKGVSPHIDLIKRDEFEALKAEVAALRAELASLKSGGGS